MIKPTIHLNGTGRQALSEQYANAMKALQLAIEAVQEAAPNTRDYYPQGDLALTRANAEHNSRVERLKAIREDYYQLYEWIEEHA